MRELIFNNLILQKRYKITITYAKEYYYDILLKELDKFVREAEKLQGTKVEIKNLPIHEKYNGKTG